MEIKWIPRRRGAVRWELWVMRKVFKVQEEWIDRGGQMGMEGGEKT